MKNSNIRIAEIKDNLLHELKAWSPNGLVLSSWSPSGFVFKNQSNSSWFEIQIGPASHSSSPGLSSIFVTYMCACKNTTGHKNSHEVYGGTEKKWAKKILAEHQDIVELVECSL